MDDTNIHCEFSGTTAVVCLVLNGQVYTAGVGNSRALLAQTQENEKMVGIQLTTDHLPNLPKEKSRILSNGGRVFPIQYDDGTFGPCRVWLCHMDVPGLALSRSLGDSIAKTVGVISSPDCSVYNLGQGSKYLIVASAGLWGVMSNEEVVNIVARMDETEKCVHALEGESSLRWIKRGNVIDDFSCCLIKFVVKE